MTRLTARWAEAEIEQRTVLDYYIGFSDRRVLSEWAGAAGRL